MTVTLTAATAADLLQDLARQYLAEEITREELLERVAGIADPRLAAGDLADRVDELVTAVDQLDQYDAGNLTWYDIDPDLTGWLEEREAAAWDIAADRVEEATRQLLPRGVALR